MNNTFYQELIEAILSCNTSEEVDNLLKGILTPKELDELPKRLQIVKMIKQGVPQHTIAEKLGVGVATVSRGSREIQMGRFKHVE